MNQRSNIWFDSPFIKPNCLFNPPIIKQDLQNDPQESIMRPQIIFQEPPSSIFKFNTHPLSPWSSCVNPNIQRFSSQKQPAPNYKIECDKDQEIVQMINAYSDEQINPTTPIRHNRNDCEDGHDSQIQTTGKKSIIGNENTNRKSRPKQKGLRQLSQKVYRIIQSLQRATYKEVAAELVNQLNQISKVNEKQEQNIKRRVYDSLNVLVSLGKLAKEGHIIYCSKDIMVTSNATQKIRQMTHQIIDKNIKIKKKQEKLKQVQQKYQLIQHFLERNKSLKLKEQIIRFPYIGITYSDASMNAMVHQQQQLYLQSSAPFSMFGDIDSVKWLDQLPKISP